MNEYKATVTTNFKRYYRTHTTTESLDQVWERVHSEFNEGDGFHLTDGHTRIFVPRAAVLEIVVEQVN